MNDNQDQIEENYTEGYTGPFLTYSNLATSCRQNSNTFLFKQINKRLFHDYSPVLGTTEILHP